MHSSWHHPFHLLCISSECLHLESFTITLRCALNCQYSCTQTTHMTCPSICKVAICQNVLSLTVLVSSTFSNAHITQQNRPPPMILWDMILWYNVKTHNFDDDYIFLQIRCRIFWSRECQRMQWNYVTDKYCTSFDNVPIRYSSIYTIWFDFRTWCADAKPFFEKK